jgi:DNA-binding CsgD family transcriptional regulator
VSKSARLRLGDLREALRLAGECRDLGADPEAWRRHAFRGLTRLIGARAAFGGEIRWRRPDGPIQVIQSVDEGLPPADRAVFLEYMRLHGPMNDPITAHLKRLRGRLVTRTRRQLLGDPKWYASEFFHRYHEGAGIDHCVNSLCEPAADGVINAIGLHRSVGDRDFSAREVRLLHLAHDELGRLIGPVLEWAGTSLVVRLSPRLRQALDGLLAGDSEKQLAARLGISRPTVHDYIDRLYRHFGVSSRAELLARFIRRRPGC